MLSGLCDRHEEDRTQTTFSRHTKRKLTFKNTGLLILVHLSILDVDNRQITQFTVCMCVLKKQFATNEEARCHPPDEFCYHAVKIW